MHLLLIEDDLDLGRALQSALKVEGLSSEWLRRAADAPQAVDAARFDCVLLDLALPDGSGLDLLLRWRQAGVQVPVIVITARSAVADRLAGLDGGADDFVVKPFATEELVARIRAVLRRAARQARERWVLGALARIFREEGVGSLVPRRVAIGISPPMPTEDCRCQSVRTRSWTLDGWADASSRLISTAAI